VNSAQRVRVIVGEDQAFVREGIVRVLDDGDFEVLGTASDARDLVRLADVYRPDVVVADIQMPPDNSDDGLRAALAIRAAQPGVGVLVLSQFLEDAYALALVADGAQGVGYLLKEKVGDLRMFTDAVRRVADGGSVLDPDVVARLVGRKRTAGPLDNLTPRERQVLALIAEGRSNAGIAQQLTVTVAAIERHVTRIFDKLGLNASSEGHRRVLAVLKYLHALPWPSDATVVRARRDGFPGLRPGRRRVLAVPGSRT
jgi:DNA-binding NarL/FixJ family response regulator